MPKGYENSYFYLGKMDNPTAIMTYGEIEEYLTEGFWSGFEIWNNTRLTGSLPVSPVWGNNPKRIIDLITAYQNQYEFIMRG